MTALYVTGGVLALLVLLLLLRLKVYFSFYGGKPIIGYGVLFFKFETPIRGYSPPAEGKESEKGEKKPAKGQEKGADKPELVKERLLLFKDAVLDFGGRFKRYLRLEGYKLKISLATDDPAKTAVLYGVLSGAVCALHEFAESLKTPPFKKVEVFTEYRPDFYAVKTDAAIELGFSIRIWQLAVCLIKALGYYRRLKRLPKKLEEKTKGDD